MIPLEKGPRRITQEDLDKVIGYAGVVRLPEDFLLAGIVPRDIIVDGQRGIERPIGMGAVRLEVDAIVLTAGSSQLEACEAAIRPLRTELAGKYANAICSAEAVLTSEEKEWGAAVVDIGAGTTDIAIYTEKSLIRLGILPIGSSNITRDIAQVLQVPVDHAENLKIKFGTARPAMVDKDEIIDSASMAVGAEASLGSAISRCELCRVIEARVYEIVEQVALMLEQEGLFRKAPLGHSAHGRRKPDALPAGIHTGEPQSPGKACKAFSDIKPSERDRLPTDVGRGRSCQDLPYGSEIRRGFVEP